MMRLLLNENKIKTYLFVFAFTFFISFACLYCLRLVGFCASSGGSNVNSQLPLQYGVGSGYGYSKSDSDVQSAIELVLLNYQQFVGGSNEQVKWIYMLEEGTDYIKLRATRGDCFVNVTSNHTYPDFNYVSSITYNNLNISGSGYSFLIQNGSISLIWDNFNIASSDTFVETSPSGSSIQKHGFVYGFPLWSYDNQSIQSTGGQDLLVPFTGGGDLPSVSGFEGYGFGSLTPNSSTGGYDFDLDLNFEYDDSGVTSRLDIIDDSINGLGDKIDTSNNWLGRIWQAISDYFSPPDSDDIADTLDNYPVISDLTSTVNDTKSTVNNIFDFDNIQPKTADNVDFDYEFQWKVYVPQLHAFQSRTTTIHIVFSWFESVRTPVTMVLTIFLVLGFLVYVFRQIPNLINGVGAGASAGQSIADMNNSSGKGNGKK